MEEIRFFYSILKTKYAFAMSTRGEGQRQTSEKQARESAWMNSGSSVSVPSAITSVGTSIIFIQGEKGCPNCQILRR